MKSALELYEDEQRTLREIDERRRLQIEALERQKKEAFAPVIAAVNELIDAGVRRIGFKDLIPRPARGSAEYSVALSDRAIRLYYNGDIYVMQVFWAGQRRYDTHTTPEGLIGAFIREIAPLTYIEGREGDPYGSVGSK